MTIKILKQRIIPGDHTWGIPPYIGCEIAISQDDQIWYRLDVGGIPQDAEDLQAALDARFSELFDVALSKGEALDSKRLVFQDGVTDKWKQSPLAGMTPDQIVTAVTTVVDSWKTVDDVVGGLRKWLPLIVAEMVYRGIQDDT